LEKVRVEAFADFFLRQICIYGYALRAYPQVQNWQLFACGEQALPSHKPAFGYALKNCAQPNMFQGRILQEKGWSESSFFYLRLC
jgi:hypothetical protein